MADLAVSNHAANKVLIFLGNGDGTFQTALDFAVGAGPFQIANGDFNGDTHLDLAVNCYYGDSVSILLGDGTGSFVASSSVMVGASPYDVEVGDFNNDGRLDFVTPNSGASTVSVVLGNGDGTFAPAVGLQVAMQNYFPISLKTGDFNNDGNMDIAVANFLVNLVVLFQGAGDGSFLHAGALGTGTQPYSIAAGDLNSNGTIDLVNTNGSGSTISVFLNNAPSTGVPSSTEFRVNSFVPGWQLTFPETPQAVAVADNGDFVVTWTRFDVTGSSSQDGSADGVFAQRFSAAGARLGAEFQVNTYFQNDQNYSTVAMDPAGNFVITWTSTDQDGSVYGVYARRYNAVGIPKGNEFRVNSTTNGGQLYSSIAMADNGDFVIVWVDNDLDGSAGGIFGQRFNAAGLAQGSEFRMNTYTNNDQTLPAVAIDAKGEFVVTWTSYGQDVNAEGVYAQRYDADGVAQGGEIAVTTETAGRQRNSTVAKAANGDFVVVWMSRDQDGSGEGIYGQRFAANGGRVGVEFRINTYTNNDQTYPAVAIDAVGNVLVTWTSTGNDGDSNGIFGQRFNSVGGAIGGEFQVNSVAQGNQRNASVAMNGAGASIVVWTGDGSGVDGTDIFAKRFAPINDAPVINDQSLPVLIENSADGTVVGTVAASDPITSQSLTYAIVGGNASSAFTINPTTGQITVANSLAIDFETHPIFSLEIEVTDNGTPSLSSSATVTVNLLNQFEVTFSALQSIVPLYQYPLSAPNTLNDYWQRVLAAATSSHPVTVVINPSSGPLSPVLGGADYANYLNGLTQLRANPNVRILGYVATGFGAIPSATVLEQVGWYANGYKHGTTGASLIDGIFLDEMSNNAAHISTYTAIANGIRSIDGLAGHFIAGNPGTAIPEQYLAEATADLFITREGSLEQFLANPDPAYVTSAAYSHLAFGAIIHSVTGLEELTDTLRQLKLRGMDYGFVTDDVAPNEYDQVPTFFDDYFRDIHAPYFHPSPQVSLPENSANNTFVLGLTAGDPDAGQSLTYAITGGNTGGAFAINPTTGRLTVANSTALNFEAGPVWTLTVTVFDNSASILTDTAILTIGLVDQPEGTTGNDAFTMTYSANSVAITIKTNTGPTTSLGNFPLTAPLTLFGLGGTDSVKIIGTSGSDVIEVSSSVVVVNGGTLILNSTESLLLVGGAGNDTYRFDTDNALGLISLDEVGGGIDTLDFSLTDSVGVSLNLAVATTQGVNANLSLNLKSGSTFENVTGGSFNDTITGNALANVLRGGSGSDSLLGSSGDDLLEGGVGNDSQDGGTGNDTYLYDVDANQGTETLTDTVGVETISFVGSAANVTFDLGSNLQQNVNGTLLKLSSATTFDNLTGGDGNDTLTGNAGVNTLIGGAGNDTLAGAAGNDIYLFDADTSLGSDSLTDAVGTETISFVGTLADVALNLGLTTPQVVNGSLTLSLGSAIDFDTLVGGDGNDTLTGNTGVNSLTGGAGNNVLAGGTGNDTYVFDADLILGSDTIDEAVGAGTDTLSFSLTTTKTVTMNLETTGSQVVAAGNLSIELLSGAVIENITGGSLGDTLTGNALANGLNGGAGNDLLIGGGGNDTLAGAAGDDTLVGGAGNEIYPFDTDSAIGTDTIDESGGGLDTLDFTSTTTQAVTVNLSLGTVQVVNFHHSLILGSGVTIENVKGGSMSDTLTGNSLANTLTGNAGDDTLNGGDGDDMLSGNAGNDILNGGLQNDVYQFDVDVALGSDTINDPAGADVLDFALTTTAGISLDLAVTSVQALHATNMSLTLPVGTVMETVLGTAKNDTILGNGADNILVGNAGNDVLQGRAGRDILIGGLGADTLDGGTDDDILIGGKTTSDAVISKLNDIRTEWISGNLYATRIVNLRAGVSPTGASLKAKVTVTNDAASGSADIMTGGLGEDWFFKALDDVITELVAGETLNLL